MKNKVNKVYAVYRVTIHGFFYYGMTSDPEVRRLNHCRSIKRLFREEKYKMSHTITRELLFHHTVAKYIIDNNLDTEMYYLKYEMKMCIVFHNIDLSKVKKVERFLIENSIDNEGCLNNPHGF